MGKHTTFKSSSFLETFFLAGAFFFAATFFFAAFFLGAIGKSFMLLSIAIACMTAQALAVRDLFNAFLFGSYNDLITVSRPTSSDLFTIILPITTIIWGIAISFAYHFLNSSLSGTSVIKGLNLVSFFGQLQHLF